MYISKNWKFNNELLELTVSEINEISINVLIDLMDKDNDDYNYIDMIIYIKSYFSEY